VHTVLQTAGQPLDATVRADMEARFDADFSDVRIHRDAAADRSTRAVDARAYTSGNHVVLGTGGSNDRRLLAHELTHVLQQREGPVGGTDTGDGLRVSDPSDRWEREADANASRVLHGGPARVDAAPAAGRVEPFVQRAISAELRGRAEGLSKNLHPFAEPDTAAGELGYDPFGKRRSTAQRPSSIPDVDPASLPAAAVAGHLRQYDLASPPQHTPAAGSGTSPALPAVGGTGKISQGAHGEVPHLVHAIWFGGPLYDDSAEKGHRQKFKTNIGKMAADQPGFTFVVWTDVTRKEATEATGAAPDGQAARVADMISWARGAEHRNLVIANIDEVTSGRPLELEPETRTERGRNEPGGFAAASDLARVAILHRYGGVYTDGDNYQHFTAEDTQRREADGRTEVSPLHEALDAVAAAPSGFAIHQASVGRGRSNAALFAAAGSKGTAEYLKLLRENYRKPATALGVPEPWQNTITGDTTAEQETINRTGPSGTTYDQLDKTLKQQEGGLTVFERDKYLVIQSGASWFEKSKVDELGDPLPLPDLAPAKGALPPYFLKDVKDAVEGAVTALFREVKVRDGGLYLPAAARSLGRLPADQREVAWIATLMAFKERIVQAGASLSWYTALNLTDTQFPASAREFLSEIFPHAADYGTDKGEKEPAVGPLSFGDKIRQAAPEAVQPLADQLRERYDAMQKRIGGAPLTMTIDVTGYGNSGKYEAAKSKLTGTAVETAGSDRATSVANELGKQLADLNVVINPVNGRKGQEPRGDGRRQATITYRIQHEGRMLDTNWLGLPTS
jgi:hypothetical protein